MSAENGRAGAGCLETAEFVDLVGQAARAIARFADSSASRRIRTDHSGKDIRAHLERYTFADPIEPARALSDCVEMLERWNTDTTHPRHFGWFNPSPHLAGVVAEVLVAGYNPQLAVWQSSPVGTEIELHLLRYLGGRLGYQPGETDGSFSSGGAEANLTAIVLALTAAFPGYGDSGLAACAPAARCYASAEFHRTIEKAAAVSGLGRDAVRLIPVSGDGVMDVAALAAAIDADRRDSKTPFMVVANAGSTNMGALDPLRAIAGICHDSGLWFHLDAAWGGAAAFSDSQRHLLAGAEQADSITLDPHKWLSMPLGTGAILTRHRETMRAAFKVNASYAIPGPERDFYTSSIQWSRRLCGLALFLALAIDGRAGTAGRIDHQAAMADLLRARLEADGWSIDSNSPFPVVCFHDENQRGAAARIAKFVNGRGGAWIADTALPSGLPALRACITSFRTQPEDIDALVGELRLAREAVASSTDVDAAESRAT